MNFFIFFGFSYFLLYSFYSNFNRSFRPINNFICIFYLFYLFFGKASSFQSYSVNSVNFCPVAGSNEIRRNILYDHGTARYKNGFAYADELMNCAKTAEYRIILNFYMSCKGSVIRKNIPVAYSTVVSYMHVHHEKITFAHYCNSVAGYGAGIYSYVFSYYIVIAYNKFSIFAFILKVLRNRTYRSELKYFISVADRSVAFYHHMRGYVIVFSYFHAAFYNSIGPDFGRFVYYGSWINYCSFIYH
ncbi:MAG: hypothetical protein D084_Lepto4C00623G0001, partial [Leptospirillum sp. Group IV 'UBA BS']